MKDYDRRATGERALAIANIYGEVAEHYNNDVLKRLLEEREVSDER